VVNDVPPAERGIAMVFQSYALYPHMNLFDNMAFGLKLAKVPQAEIDTAVNNAAKILHIEHLLQRKPKDLSGGQRQRVAIGRAIVRKPEVFLFDEPLSNLDTALRVKMRYEFAKLHEQFKTTMVYVTHDQVEAMTLADRIVVLQAGRIEQVGAPMELYEHPCNLFVAGFIGSPGMNILDATVEQARPRRHRAKLGGGETHPLRRWTRRRQARRQGQAGRAARTPACRRGRQRAADHGDLRGALGSMTYAYCSNAGAEDVVTAAVEGDRHVDDGQALALGVPAEKTYLFNAEGRAYRRLAAADIGMRLERSALALLIGLCLTAAAWRRPRCACWSGSTATRATTACRRSATPSRAKAACRWWCSTPKARRTSSPPPRRPARARTSCAGRTTASANGPRRGLVVPVRPAKALRAQIDDAAWGLHLPRPDLGLPAGHRGHRPDLQQGPGARRRRPASRGDRDRPATLGPGQGRHPLGLQQQLLQLAADWPGRAASSSAARRRATWTPSKSASTRPARWSARRCWIA
jgi:multiple sugar transport system ATP-binding protein